MKKNKTTVIAILALAVLAAALAAVWLLVKDAPAEGEKAVALQVVIDGQTVWSETVRTDALYLRQVLEEAGLVSADEGAFITTVNGRTAAGEEWWCLTKGGEMLMTGAGETVVEDGGSFELTLTVGWDEW